MGRRRYDKPADPSKRNIKDVNPEFNGGIEEAKREIRRLRERNAEAEKEIRRLREQNGTLKEEKEVADQAIEELQESFHKAEAELETVRTSYDIIRNSTFWKITKPFRVVLDGVKWAVKRPKKRTIGDGIRSLKNNGVKHAFRRAKSEILSAGEEGTGDSDAAKGNALQDIFTEQDLEEQRTHVFASKLTFSIIVPLYNTAEKFLREMIESVQAQTYGDWELCMADGSDRPGGETGRIAEEYAKKDSRIRYRKLERNLGISGNTNAALEMATGEYIALFDHDDLLHPAALYEVMRTITDLGADYIYTDEAIFRSPDRNSIVTVHFKPDFAPDTLRSNNYLCHFSVFKRTLLERVGLFDSECDGSQDHDMVLRLTAAAERVAHIPEVLYYWRSHQGSVAGNMGSKPYVVKAGVHAVEKSLKEPGRKVESINPGSTIYRIHYDIKGTPKVSVLIADPGQPQKVLATAGSIIRKTSWPEYEIVIICRKNKTAGQDAYGELAEQPNVRILMWNGSNNLTAMLNYAAQQADGEYLLTVREGLKVRASGWIEEMLMYAQREDVGAVGAKVTYSDGSICQAGIGLGITGLAGSYFKHVEKENGGYWGRLTYVQDVSAVSDYCLMIRKNIWDMTEGFDEVFRSELEDVDLCLRIRRKGYLIVWTPYAELCWIGRKWSTDAENVREDISARLVFKKRWSKELEQGDPYYNPNLSVKSTVFQTKAVLTCHDAR